MEFLNTLSVAQVLERAAALASHKIAVVDGDRRKTYRELNAMVDSLARSLSELGFRKGDRVAIYMKNSLELVIAFYGLQKIGAVVAWVSPNYRRSEAEFILKNSQSRGHEPLTLSELRAFLKNKIAPYKLPDELCFFSDFPRLSGGVKIKKFGKGGLVKLARVNESRQRHRS